MAALRFAGMIQRRSVVFFVVVAGDGQQMRQAAGVDVDRDIAGAIPAANSEIPFIIKGQLGEIEFVP